MDKTWLKRSKVKGVYKQSGRREAKITVCGLVLEVKQKQKTTTEKVKMLDKGVETAGAETLLVLQR